jgi:hypothetical protein
MDTANVFAVIDMKAFSVTEVAVFEDMLRSIVDWKPFVKSKPPTKSRTVVVVMYTNGCISKPIKAKAVNWDSVAAWRYNVGIL